MSEHPIQNQNEESEIASNPTPTPPPAPTPDSMIWQSEKANEVESTESD